MGTPDFSVKTLEKLYSDKDIEISYVVTKIDSKSNRGQKINFSDVKKKAIEYGLDVLQPIKIKDDRETIERIKSAEPDFIIVVAYGQILSKEILDIPKYACINGHASLLPKYRGASPIQSAILSGDEVTGTTTMLMNQELDIGDILEQEMAKIDKKETAEKILREFGLDPAKGHIVNGHVPVKEKAGEHAIKANGRVFIIDGGIAKAYHDKTGIAGYTLIFNSHALSLAVHEPFEAETGASPKLQVAEYMNPRVRVADTDLGKELRAQADALEALLTAYNEGSIKERNRPLS